MLISAHLFNLTSLAVLLGGASPLPVDLKHEHTATCGHVIEDEAIYAQLAAASENVPNAWEFEKPVEVSVAVWYPPKWRELVGDNEIDARIEQLMEWANRSLGNSQVNAEYNVVFARELEWEEVDPNTGEVIYSTLFSQSLDEYPTHMISYVNDSDWELIGTDGNFQFSYQSYLYGADIVLWIQEENTDSGYAPYGDASISQLFNSPGHARVYDQSHPYGQLYEDAGSPPVGPELFEWTTRHTGVLIAHELGHTLGLAHHRSQHTDETNERFDNSPMWNTAYSSYCGFGEAPRSRNVMHGGHTLTQQAQLLFSSPDYDLNGQVCSDATYENQAATLNSWIPFLNQIGQAPDTVGTVRFASSVFTSENGALKVDVIRDGDLSVETEVEVNAFNGSAIAGVHYQGAKQVVRFAPEQERATVVFEVLEANPGDFFNLRLQYPLGLEIDGQYAVGTTTETDHTTDWRGDFKIPSHYDITDREIRKFPIERSGDTSKAAVVYVSTDDGTATAGQDYQGFDRAVYFAPGETEKQIDVFGYPSDSDVTFYIELSSPMNASFTNARTEVSKLSGVRGQVGFVGDFAGQTYTGVYSSNGGNNASSSPYRDFSPCQGGYLHGRLDPSAEFTGSDVEFGRVRLPSNRTFEKQYDCRYIFLFDRSYQLPQEFSFDVVRRNGSRGDVTFTVRPIGWEDYADIAYDEDGNEIDYYLAPRYVSADVFEDIDQTFTLADGETSMTVTYRISDEGMESLREYLSVPRDLDDSLGTLLLQFIAFDEHDVNYYRSPEHRGTRLPEAMIIYFRSLVPPENTGVTPPPTAPQPPAPPEPEKTKGSSTNFMFFLLLLISAFATRRRNYQ